MLKCNQPPEKNRTSQIRGWERLLTVVLMCAFSASGIAAEPLNPQRYEEMRKQVRERTRNLVFHSDGMAMNPKLRYLEPTESVLPYLPGTQTSACTYSLIHQFPVARLYRTKIGTEHPPGIVTKMYGEKTDGLHEYISFCRKNGYEAFWAMRTNDTHDASGSEHGQRRLQSNQWKLDNMNLLVGEQDNQPPYAGWTAYDYAEREVREKVFLVLEEVCNNYDIDGIVIDFFRHLPTFKSTAWGETTSDDERKKLTTLFRRTRAMLDKIGKQRGRPIMLAVRTPDGLSYCKDLGIDVEHWMQDQLIDIWIATGYFRLQDWEKTVAIGHSHGVQVWASMDESRVKGRDNRNSVESYRARIANAWRSGVDAVWMFNFFYHPPTPHFQLLHEAGDLASLAFKDKTYVADGRGKFYTKLYLPDGESYLERPTFFSPQYPQALKQGTTESVTIRVGDDLLAAGNDKNAPTVSLQLQTVHIEKAKHLKVTFNKHVVNSSETKDTWIAFPLEPATVKQGDNQITITGIQPGDQNITLRDLQLHIRYPKH